jgi:hypothetical protein
MRRCLLGGREMPPRSTCGALVKVRANGQLGIKKCGADVLGHARAFRLLPIKPLPSLRHSPATWELASSWSWTSPSPRTSASFSRRWCPRPPCSRAQHREEAARCRSGCVWKEASPFGCLWHFPWCVAQECIIRLNVGLRKSWEGPIHQTLRADLQSSCFFAHFEPLFQEMDSPLRSTKPYHVAVAQRIVIEYVSSNSPVAGP